MHFVLCSLFSIYLFRRSANKQATEWMTLKLSIHFWVYKTIWNMNIFWMVATFWHHHIFFPFSHSKENHMQFRQPFDIQLYVKERLAYEMLCKHVCSKDLLEILAISQSIHQKNVANERWTVCTENAAHILCHNDNDDDAVDDDNVHCN